MVITEGGGGRYQSGRFTPKHSLHSIKPERGGGYSEGKRKLKCAQRTGQKLQLELRINERQVEESLSPGEEWRREKERGRH